MKAISRVLSLKVLGSVGKLGGSGWWDFTDLRNFEGNFVGVAWCDAKIRAGWGTLGPPLNQDVDRFKIDSFRVCFFIVLLF